MVGIYLQSILYQFGCVKLGWWPPSQTVAPAARIITLPLLHQHHPHHQHHDAVTAHSVIFNSYIFICTAQFSCDWFQFHPFPSLGPWSLTTDGRSWTPGHRPVWRPTYLEIEQGVWLGYQFRTPFVDWIVTEQELRCKTDMKNLFE